MKEEVQASVQLIMSKISAGQFLNAPGLFEGADSRKLAQEQEEMKEGQIALRHRQIAYFDMVSRRCFGSLAVCLSFDMV